MSSTQAQSSKLRREAKTKSKNELLPGTLEMLILKTLSIESMLRYGIAQHTQMLWALPMKVADHEMAPGLSRPPTTAATVSLGTACVRR